MRAHTAPWECVYAKEDSSVCKPGKKLSSDDEYFEILCLTVLQSGLSWNLIRKKWSKLRKTFSNFSFLRIAKYNSRDVKLLMKNPTAIRNEKKIKAIIHNAREFQRIIAEYGSFRKFLRVLRKRSFDERIEKLTKRFKYIGRYSAEYYLHSIGELE
jgi:3-methyladenine DNA glycosylase Tag